MPKETSMKTFTISGKVLHKESGIGVPDLLIDLFDLDKWSDPESRDSSSPPAISTNGLPDIADLYKTGDRVGSSYTDANGMFRFEVTDFDFNLPRKSEQKPDLLMLVLAPDEPGLDLKKRVLHFSNEVRFNAGSNEAYLIRLSTALLTEKAISFGSPQEESKEKVKDDIDVYVNEQRRELEFNAGAADFHNIEATKKTLELKAFRKDFIKTIATDFNLAPLTGVVADDDDNIQKKNYELVTTGMVKANDVLANSNGVPVNLYLTPTDKTNLKSFFEGATEGSFVEIPDSELKEILFRTNSTENPGTLLVQNNPIAAFCLAESADTKCAKAHSGVAPESNGQVVPRGNVVNEAMISNDDISRLITRVVQDIPSPDLVLRPELARQRANRTDLEKAVNDFSLQKGPAEVPAFYDFNVLQIAFDHVWKRLFDETIPPLAFTANTLGQSNYGITNVVGQMFVSGTFVPTAHHTIHPVPVPAAVAMLFDITKIEFNELSFSLRQVLHNIANQIRAIRPLKVQDLRRIQTLTERGERLIDTVRHDDYFTLHKTLRDLQERLSGKYEFTVFAADKNHHSVNFGLVNTYRQQWTPLTYQAGRLVRTIPLSPKEERKYSVKSTRNEKRSSKEAKKNNSSITSEQHSTSRVEADIMAKAQNKTTFGISAEADFDIGISSGKSTTTFGVEALNESAQNRKDFHEAVLKAVQDYKEETSTEIVSELDTSSEFNESGSICNNNDELSLTCLFYELQKRYRISEKLNRVMPVVLVAQEMPSPDHITPAWVIANDWILNRFLLDDSFRPTLRYLASNSVGDDFCLRELRRNLRQQRNLVDTLKIEFATASREAENKYAALLEKVTARLDEQEDAAGQGFFTSVGAFFGADDASPDVARARELAASDEHKYAVDKAEKIAAALQTEVQTLHALTDKHNKTLQEKLDNETKVKRLLVHIRNNIFYYMQAIWSLEPPDQRYLRLHKVKVPILELESRSFSVSVDTDLDIFAAFRERGTEKHKAFLHGTLKHNPGGTFETKSLVEMADLDSLLGFKGNYMIFPMKEHNALTEFMAAPYIDSAFGAMDPDELSNVNLDEYSKYICCLHDSMPAEEFEAIKEELKAWLQKLLATPLRNGDEIVVPTGSLFIETLVDPNPTLEDFKLKHRELDVFKVEEEVRRGALENLRLAARLLNAEREDPDIEKKIVVEGGLGTVIDVDNP